LDLEQNAGGTAVSFEVEGILHDTSGTANISGMIQAEFTGSNPQQALALIEAGNSANYMGNLTVSGGSAVPEPSTVLLVTLGLSAVLLGKRRFARP
jgi:hypothetical protein